MSIPQDPTKWDGIWIFRFSKQLPWWAWWARCKHDWQPWTGNAITRTRICSNCKWEETAEWVI